MFKIKQLLILITSTLFLLGMFTSCGGGASEEEIRAYTIELQPAIDDIRISTTGYYLETETITIAVDFNKVVNVTVATPRLELDIGGTTVFADYISGTGTKTLTFTYDIIAGLNDNDGITAISPLDLAGATIKDNYNNDLILTFVDKGFSNVFVDTTVPTFQSITKPSDGDYIPDDTLSFSITFNEDVQVSGTPRIELQLDSGNVYLEYVSGDGTDTLIFEYLLQITDDDPVSGIGLASVIDLNTGSIQDVAGNDADLNITPGVTSGIKVTNDISHTISFTINNDDPATASTATTLNIAATNATEMYITNDPTCSAGGAWEAYATSVAWTLPSTNATNTSYIKFRSASLYESTCYSDDIIHDDINPTAPTLSLGSDATTTDGDSFSLSGGDGTGSNIASYEVAISTSTSDADIIASGTYKAFTGSSYQYTGATLITGDQYYYILKTIDEAGNEVISASSGWYVLDQPAPISNLSMVERTKDSIKIAWTPPDPNGPAITGYQIDFKEGAGSWSTIVASHPTTDYTHTGLTPDTEYSYRVYSTNGTYTSNPSNTLVTGTLPDLPEFESNYIAVNVGGATQCRAVSLEDGNTFLHNGVDVGGTYNKTDTYTFTCAQFDTLEASGKFFVAGRRSDSGSTSSNKIGNIVWSPTSWVGKEFLFNHTRNTTANISIYAYTDSDVTITRNGTPITSASLNAGTSTVLTVNPYASYELSSTGYILGHMFSGTGTDITDPKPLLPISTDITGFPSTKGDITSSANSNNVTIYNSGEATSTTTLSAGTTYSHTVSGTTSLYNSHVIRIISDVAVPMIGVSTADSNGHCSAPFIPTALMKNTFGINTDSDYVAFTSLAPASITYTNGSNGSTTTINLTRTTNEDNVPYRAYISGTIPEGSVFESTDKFQAWYQPNNNTAGANEDETILFGW